MEVKVFIRSQYVVRVHQLEVHEQVNVFGAHELEGDCKAKPKSSMPGVNLLTAIFIST